MKNNVPLHLALSSIKKDRKNYKISFVMMIIAFLIVFLFPALLECYQQVRNIQNVRDYGNWSVCYHNLSKESKDFLASNKLVESISDISYVGMVEDYGYIANYNSNFFDIASIELLEGNLPKHQNEIIVLQNKGYSLNDMITVSYYTDQLVEKEYKVVGIMNDYNKKWTVTSPDYFTYQNEEYKNYVYVTSSISLQDFEGFSADSVYNFALLDNVYYEKNQGVSFQGKTLEVYTYNNYYIIVVSLGLLMAILSNVQNREKTVFLLRCIGMSHKDMKKYIFYEVIAIALIAFGISSVVGLLLLIGITYYVYSHFGLFLLFDLVILSLKYSVVIMIIIIGITYLSIFPVSFRMMDSLIHKKERTQLKKYNRAKKMNVFNLARKLCNHHFSHLSIIISLVLTITGCIISINKDIPLIYKNDEKSVTYQYHYSIIDSNFINLHSSSITNYREFKENRIEFDDYYGTVLSLDSLDYTLEEGRLPINSNECLVYDVHGRDSYSLGEKLFVKDTIYVEDKEVFFDEYEGIYDKYDPENKIATIPIHTFTVVGKVNVDSLYNFAIDNYLYNIDEKGFVILDSAIEELDKSWGSHTVIHSHKDIYLDICDLRKDNAHYINYIANVTSATVYDTITSVLLMSTIAVICIYFLFVEINIFIDKMNKDLKLIRCLGLTIKQCMKIYRYAVVVIGCLSVFYLYLYFLLIRNNQLIFQESNNTLFMTFTILCIILVIVITMILVIAYQKTNKTLEFYPTEVERYY